MLTDQAARDAVLPPELRGRPLEDSLVVAALERWAAGQAAAILAGLFIVAAVVTAAGGHPDAGHVGTAPRARDVRPSRTATRRPAEVTVTTQHRTRAGLLRQRGSERPAETLRTPVAWSAVRGGWARLPPRS